MNNTNLTSSNSASQALTHTKHNSEHSELTTIANWCNILFADDSYLQDWSAIAHAEQARLTGVELDPLGARNVARQSEALCAKRCWANGQNPHYCSETNVLLLLQTSVFERLSTAPCQPPAAAIFSDRHQELCVSVRVCVCVCVCAIEKENKKKRELNNYFDESIKIKIVF